MAPSILTQPVSQFVEAGSNVTFSVTVGGTPSLSFQWYFNGTNLLSSATNRILTLASVVKQQAGNYNVVVSNSVGIATSSNALLTISSPLFAQEPFNYNPGSALNGQGNWLLVGTGTSPVIESGNLFAAGLANASGNRTTWGSSSMSTRLPIGTNISGAMYFSFAMRIENLGAFTTAGTFAGFTTGTGTSFGTKMNIRTNAAGGFNLGVSKGGGTTFGNWAAGNYNVGETLFIVGRYQFLEGNGTNDTCDLWINPAAATFGTTNPPSASVGGVGFGGADLPQIDRFFFRSGGSSSSPIKTVADELRVGLTWASVTPVGTATLKVLTTNNTAQIFWPASLSNFSLEETATLSAPSWTPVNGTVSVIGTNNVVTVNLTNSSQFFRLRK